MPSPLVRSLLTVLATVLVVVPLGTAALANPQERLDEVRRQIEGTRQGLDRVEGQKQATAADLAAIERRRAELDDELAALNVELEGAEEALGAAERRLERTTARVARTENELDETRAELEEQRAIFGARARSAYIHGGVTTYASMLLDLEDFSEFERSVRYVQEVVNADRRQVERITELRDKIAVTLAELQDLRQRQDAQRQVAEEERDRVAAVLARRQEVRRQVAAEAQRHREVIAQLEVEGEGYVAHLASLDDERLALEDELRRLEEERRRQEEERRRREAEAAARREEAARREAEAQRRRDAEASAAAARDAEQARREEAAARSARSSSQQAAAPRSPAPAPAVAASSSGRMFRPSDGRISSGYGFRVHPITGVRRMHSGVDFAAPTGAPIYAAESGTVYSAGWRGGYGNAVLLDHGNGLMTLYAHQSRIGVSVGQRVSRGQVIGATGSTGMSTGPHLHFEVWVNGSTRDPMGYL